MSQAQTFERKTVVVTGGTSGIGAHTALRFAEAGASVVSIGLQAAGP
ncbi:2-deoxy-D-gluconate 3-dehydrogenase, partial [Burkholderia multivorans]